MSYKIIILQHTPLVTPGYFTKLMNEDLVETTIIRLDEGEKIPVNLDIFDGMICLGGPMDTWMEEQYPWMIDEKNKIKEFVLNNQKPYLGICLGCQFLGEILGGKVIKSNPPEIGVLNINILDNKKKDQLFQNFDNQIKALQWHSYEVSELNKKINEITKEYSISKDQEEKTEEPTARKLEKAAEEGQVLTSKEMFVFTILTVGVILMYIFPPLIEDFLKISASFFNFGPSM